MFSYLFSWNFNELKMIQGERCSFPPDLQGGTVPAVPAVPESPWRDDRHFPRFFGFYLFFTCFICFTFFNFRGFFRFFFQTFKVCFGGPNKLPELEISKEFSGPFGTFLRFSFWFWIYRQRPRPIIFKVITSITFSKQTVLKIEKNEKITKVKKTWRWYGKTGAAGTAGFWPE